MQRPDDGGLVPVKAAPLDRLLVAKGGDPRSPRLWLSGLSQRLVRAGAGNVVEAAKQHFERAVHKLFAAPKKADEDGDYFDAYLREVHPKIHKDIDHSDPCKLRKAKKVKSETKHGRRYDLGRIELPDFQEAFEEVRRFDPRKGATRKQQVLSKILVDGFQLRAVDSAAILKATELVMEAAEGERVVVVLYAGANHTKEISKFWRHQGFRSRGTVGRHDWDDDQPRGLRLPEYLQDFRKLFS